jgi:hypothetical protein
MISVTHKPRMPRLVKGNMSGSVKPAPGIQPNHEISKATAGSRDLDVVERLASLFEPDRLAQAQFFGNFRRKTLIEPEKKLTLAILEDAINCFQDNVLVESGKGKKLFADAQEWILAEGSDWIFSFRNVCELLAIDPDYLRGGLMRWKRRKLAHQYASGTCDGTKLAV